MAWGTRGQVFLGEDLIAQSEYSEETARMIDEEVERILREQEDRAREVLTLAPQGPRPGGPGAARARDDRWRRGGPPDQGRRQAARCPLLGCATLEAGMEIGRDRGPEPGADTQRTAGTG